MIRSSAGESAAAGGRGRRRVIGRPASRGGAQASGVPSQPARHRGTVTGVTGRRPSPARLEPVRRLDGRPGLVRDQ